MKATSDSQTSRATHSRPAAQRESTAAATASFQDNRPQAAGRGGLVQAVHASPLAAMQRKQISSLFGSTAQRATPLEEEMPTQGKNLTAQLASLEEEMPAQGKTAQRASIEEEMPAQGKANRGPLQAKSNTLQRKESGDAASGGGLPAGLKSGVESLSGMAMDDVNVHYNSSKPAAIQALAYTQGSDIHVAPGQEQHLPHEAWHVVQQRQGRVQPTMQMKEGIPVNDDASLEHEADVMGAQAAQRAQNLV